MSKQPSPQLDQPLAPDPAGGGWQTAVTLVLIAHLFAVVIGVLIYTLPLSPLRSKLADVPLVPQYLQLLHMDTAYNFHLTDGLESDLDHSVVIEREDVPQDQASTATTLRLPEAGTQPGIRRERFQQLAQRAAGVEGDPARPLLSKAVGSAMLRRADAPDGTYRLRIQRQMLLAREDVDSPQASLNNPDDPRRFATAYEGAIILDGADVYFSEIAPESQRAGLREDVAAGDGQP